MSSAAVGSLWRVWAAWLASAVVVGVSGCHLGEPVNPSFDLSRRAARAELRAMAENPRPFARPVVVLSGWLDPGLAERSLVRQLRELTTEDQRIVGVSFFGVGSFEACRRRVLRRVRAELMDDSDRGLPAVDVVAFSMGGLVARLAAEPAPIEGAGAGTAPASERLRIERLYTISTPHRGAELAKLPSLDRKVRRMKPGSAFLARLNGEAFSGQRLVPYVRLGDGIVGAANAAPPGRTAWWVPTPLFANAHNACEDPRLIADIARRLRGEPSLTNPPPAPLPDADRGTSERE